MVRTLLFHSKNMSSILIKDIVLTKKFKHNKFYNALQNIIAYFDKCENVVIKYQT
jgi:hypothetical protein